MEKKKFQMPHTYIIIFGVILVAALLTCFIPLGKYDTKEITYTVNGSEKTRTVVDPDSFQYILENIGQVAPALVPDPPGRLPQLSAPSAFDTSVVGALRLRIPTESGRPYGSGC